MIGWLGFYGISTFVGYLTPNPFLYNQFYLKQLSLIVKNTVELSKTFLFDTIQSNQTVLVQKIQFSISTDFVYTHLNVKTVLY